MRVKDIMVADVQTIADSDLAVQANELMWRNQIHHLVVMSGTEIVGVISDSDLGGPDTDFIPDNLKVRDLMSTKVITVSPNTSVKKVCDLMQGNKIHCLPVMDEKERLVGIVTETDILTLEKRETAQPPFQGSEPQDPDIPRHSRETHGATSKIDHPMWPGRFSKD